MTRGREIKTRNRFNKRLGDKADALPRFRALLGDGEGNLYPDTDELTIVYARRADRGRIDRVRNTRVASRNNLPVIIGYTYERPHELQVIEEDTAAMESLGAYGYVQRHGQQHSLHDPTGGDDVVWVWGQQFLPFLVQETDPISLRVEVRRGRYIYEGSYETFGGGITANLNTYAPAAGLAIMLHIVVNAASATLDFIQGDTFSSAIPEHMREEMIPLATDGQIACGAVYIPNGITEVTWDEIYDTRPFVQVVESGIPHYILSSTHIDTSPDTLVRGDLLRVEEAGTTAELVRYPIGTAHQILKVDAAGNDPDWSSFDWDEINQAAGADMVHTHLTNPEGGVLGTISYPDVLYAGRTTVLAGMDTGAAIFTDADGMLLLGPYSRLTNTTWTSQRGIEAIISGAPHNRVGRWAGTLAPIVEEGVTNEINDPIFGNSILATNWTNVGLATFERGTIHGDTGGYALHAISNNLADYCHSNTVVDADQNEVWIASCRVWVVSGDFELTVQRNIGGWADVDSVAVTELGRWIEVNIVVVMPAGSTDGRVKLGPSVTAASEFYVDWVQFETDGTAAVTASFPTTLCYGSRGTGYSWSGIAHQSSSTRVATEMQLDDSAGIFDGKNAFTIATWVRVPFDTNFHRDAVLFDVWEDDNNRYRLIYSNSDYFEGIVTVGGVSRAVQGAVTLTAGDWVHVIFTRGAGAILTLYVNGERLDYDVAAPVGTISPTRMNIGTNSNGAANHANCAFAEVIALDVELDEHQANALYASREPLVDGNGMLPTGAALTGSGGANQVAYWTAVNVLNGDPDFVYDGNDLGLGTSAPNLGGEAIGFTIEDATGPPTIELSLRDDIFPADQIIGTIRWWSGNVDQCAVGQIDVLQSGWYETDSMMRFWAADDCALCLVMELGCDPAVRMGDPAGGNYTEIENDGTLRFVGDATVWEDLRVPLERGRPAGGNQPTWAQFKTNGAGSNGVYTWQFDDGDEIWFTVQLPHSWREGSVIYPHLHWSPSSDVDPSDNVGIGLEYTWADMDETFGNTTIITRDVPTGVNNQDEHLFHNFDEAGIDGTGHTISSILVCRFFRQAAASDNYADPIWGLEVDFHYEVARAGSREILTA